MAPGRFGSGHPPARNAKGAGRRRRLLSVIWRGVDCPCLGAKGRRGRGSDRHHHLAQGDARRLLAAGQLIVQGAADNAGIGLLCIANDASLVDGLAGEARRRSRRDNLVPLRNEVRPRTGSTNLPPLLRRIVLVREPTLRLGLDVQRVRQRWRAAPWRSSAGWMKTKRVLVQLTPLVGCKRCWQPVLATDAGMSAGVQVGAGDTTLRCRCRDCDGWCKAERGADAAHVHLCDGAVLGRVGCRHRLTVGNRQWRWAQLAHHVGAHSAPPRDLTITPRRPLGIVQQPQHRPVLVGVGPAYPVGRVLWRTSDKTPE